MKPQYLNQLKEFLLKLKNSKGHFIIQNGYLDTVRNSEKKVFCQFMKNNLNDPIRIEALSHHFDESVDKKLINKFFELGFTLEEEENYSKNIYLNSDQDINNTALEIVKIFEELYKVDGDSIYDFDDQLEIVDSNSTQNMIQNITNTSIREPINISIRGWIFIIFGLMVCYYTFFDTKESHSTTQTENDSKYIVKEEAFTTLNKSDFDEMYTYIVQNDMKALSSMLDDGRIIVLPVGTEVYIMEAGFGYMVIRVSGSAEKLWISNERLRKK